MFLNPLESGQPRAMIHDQFLRVVHLKKSGIAQKAEGHLGSGTLGLPMNRELFTIFYGQSTVKLLNVHAWYEIKQPRNNLAKLSRTTCDTSLNMRRNLVKVN